MDLSAKARSKSDVDAVSRPRVAGRRRRPRTMQRPTSHPRLWLASGTRRASRGTYPGRSARREAERRGGGRGEGGDEERTTRAAKTRGWGEGCGEREGCVGADPGARGGDAAVLSGDARRCWGRDLKKDDDNGSVVRKARRELCPTFFIEKQNGNIFA